MAAALAFGVGASLLRIAFGGHYLSDALLGGLISLIVIVLARWLSGRAARPEGLRAARVGL